jgi:flavin-dependent dehydrogenase
MAIYDTIIVGAGPAGLMAARELERKSINYLILEAKAKVGYPLRCGETTREETFAELFACCGICSRIQNPIPIQTMSWSTY